MCSHTYMQEKWLEHQILCNHMRATSLRIDLLMRVVEEACKRRVYAKREIKEDVSAEKNGGLIESEQAKHDRDEDKLIIGRAKNKGGPRRVRGREGGAGGLGPVSC